MNEDHSPQHIAIIMDGNGRWAKAKGRPRLYGHVKGAVAAYRIIDACIEQGIANLSLFAFGVENWQRPDSEVEALQKLFYVHLRRKIKKLHQQGVRTRFVGDRSQLKAEFVKAIEEAEALTKHNQTLVLNMAVSYSGQWDICQAVRHCAEQVAQGKLSPDEINIQQFQRLLGGGDMPPVDLCIRSSGECRLSNFLLWHCAYAELYFTDIYWPDFDKVALIDALQWFAQRQRRFGKLAEQ